MQGSKSPAVGLRKRHRHSSCRAEDYFLLSDDNQRLTHRFHDMLRILDDILRLAGCR
jgi:hypothetical protein